MKRNGCTLFCAAALSIGILSLHASDFESMNETLVITDQEAHKSFSVGFFQLEAPPGQIDTGFCSDKKVTGDSLSISPSTAFEEPVVNDILLVGSERIKKILFSSIDIKTSVETPSALFANRDVTDVIRFETSFERKEGFGLISGSEIVLALVRGKDYKVIFGIYRSDISPQVAYTDSPRFEKFEHG